jgi:parvulin-like peptidyl-prolyl isomerase
MEIRSMSRSLRAMLAVAIGASFALIAAAQTPKPAPATKPQAAPKANPGGGDPVLATVNDEPVRRSEILRLLRGFTIPPGSEEKAYEGAVDLLINTKLLAQYLKAQRIEVKPEEVQGVVAQYEKTAKDNNSSLTNELASSEMTPEEFREQIARTLQWKAYVTRAATEAELRKYAEANKDHFGDARVRASHILIAVKPDASEAEKQKAREKALAIKKEIESGKISFADAANKYSEDPGNKDTPSGGDLDYFPRKGQFIESFTSAAFGLKKGAISDPVETVYGIHLIQVTDRRDPKPVNFERQREQILEEYAAELQTKIVDQERAKAKIDIKPMPAGLVPTEAPAATPKGAAPTPTPKGGATPKAATKGTTPRP